MRGKLNRALTRKHPHLTSLANRPATAAAHVIRRDPEHFGHLVDHLLGRDFHTCPLGSSIRATDSTVMGMPVIEENAATRVKAPSSSRMLEVKRPEMP